MERRIGAIASEGVCGCPCLSSRDEICGLAVCVEGLFGSCLVRGGCSQPQPFLSRLPFCVRWSGNPVPRPWTLTERKAAGGGPGSALPSSQDNAYGCTATASRKCLGEARWPTAQEDKRSRQALRFSFQQSLNRGPKTRSKLAVSCGTLSGLVKETGSVEELPGRDEVKMGLNSGRCSPQAQTLSWLWAVTVLSPWNPTTSTVCLSQDAILFLFLRVFTGLVLGPWAKSMRWSACVLPLWCFYLSGHQVLELLEEKPRLWP